MALSIAQQQLIETRTSNEAKSVGVAYLLWFFLGLIGGHRFYMGRVGSAIGMFFTLGGLGIWWLIDGFLIPGMIRGDLEKTRQRLTMEMILTTEAARS